MFVMETTQRTRPLPRNPRPADNRRAAAAKRHHQLRRRPRLRSQRLKQVPRLTVRLTTLHLRRCRRLRSSRRRTFEQKVARLKAGCRRLPNNVQKKAVVKLPRQLRLRSNGERSARSAMTPPTRRRSRERVSALCDFRTRVDAQATGEAVEV